MARAPLIGIEVDLAVSPTGRRFAKVYETYFDAVSTAGGVPVLVPPMPEPALTGLVLGLDGLVVPGGDDLSAELWGEVQRPCPRFVCVDARRLEAGRRLVRAILDAGLPFLGVCYGAQLMNLACGGSMLQDIPDERPGALAHHDVATHEVDVSPGTRLRELVGQERIAVNSRHHQANREPGRGLVVAARSDDGVVEAIELADAARFALGVQWHPEDLGDQPAGAPLFRGLVDAARQRRQAGAPRVACS